MRIILAFCVLFFSGVANAALDPQLADFVDACALGKLPFCKSEVKFANIEITSLERPVWPINQPYKFVDVAEQLLVVSTSSDDFTVSGGGAWRIVIIGQAAGEWVIEFVDLTGQAPKLTVNAFDYVYRVRVIESGSLTPNNDAIVGSTGAVGHLSLTTVTGGALLAVVEAGCNVTTQAIFRVPVNESWLFNRLSASVGQGNEVIFRMWVRNPLTDIYWETVRLYAMENLPSLVAHRVMSPGTDIIITAQADSGIVGASISIEVLRFGEGGISPLRLP